MKQFPETAIRVIGSLSKDVFEQCTSTGSEAFSLYTCLDANKFVLLSFFSLIKMIYPRVSNQTLTAQSVADPGERPGEPRSPPLFLDENEVRRAEKNFFWRPSPPLSQGLDDCPPLSEGLDPPLPMMQKVHFRLTSVA